MGILTKILGDPNAREIDRLAPIITKINGLEEWVKELTDEAIRARMDELKTAAKDGELDEILPEVFALTREASSRTTGLRHFDVQLLGGIALHKGKIAEMKTGEGKTLVASLPLTLNALTGRGAHLVTVNDYLARRDAGWMGAIYHFLGLSTGVIVHDESFWYDPAFVNPETPDERLKHLRPVSRKEAYAADITYGTNNEYGFDYLRDNMVVEQGQRVGRGLHYAIVDEVDSILIDEARTPLIISAPAAESTQQYYQFANLVRNLSEAEDYAIDEKLRTTTLTDAGIKKIESALGVENIYVEGGFATVHHVEQAVRAQALFKKDRDYVVKDGQVTIVDEFTGRLMPGRRWSDGLHQAVEAKENVTIERESVTLATISFQNLFRLYAKLAGMTGTAVTEAEEFHTIYNLEVLVIPPHRENQRQDANDRIYKNEEAKFRAVIEQIKARHESGQPVLVGTISIEKNELLGSMLAREGISYELMNAKNHEREAAIIANAGKAGSVTIATNMAGRGVDILLGGAEASAEEQEKVRSVGGLHVMGTERHESRRIDNQLRGRAGRQGDPGSTQFFVSLEDDLMRVFGGDRVKRLMDTFNIPEEQPIENAIVSRSLESAQKRVEGANFDSRKHLVDYDDVMNRHRLYIYKERDKILAHADLKSEILAKIEAQVARLVEFNTQETPDRWDYESLARQLSAIMSFELSWFEARRGLTRAELTGAIFDEINLAYEARERTLGAENSRALERTVALSIIDRLWVEHLDAMEHLREGIGLRGYAQKDPLVEYKHESHGMFERLLALIDEELTGTIMKVTLASNPPPSAGVTAGNLTFGRGQSAPAPSAVDAGTPASEPKAAPVITNEFKNVGRNDPCPCGTIDPATGKVYKYKRCGLINAPYHKA